MKQINEGLEHLDMQGLIKPTLHVDEFESKMGTDDDVVVLSFFVRDEIAAEDLVSWFERGYDFVIDAARSPGEVTPNRFLVYVEIRRRPSFVENLETLMTDLTNLTGVKPGQFKVRVNRQYQDYSPEVIAEQVPLTPDAYREREESALNEARQLAGLEHRPVHRPDAEIRALQDLAHIHRK